MIRRGLACAIALVPSFALAQTVCGWSTDDSFILNTTTDASAATVLADPGSGIEYAAGMSSDTATGHWVVRKRNNGTWSTVDDFIYSIGLRNHPQAMVRDSGGRILVVGGANNASNSGSWIVRRSTNAGSSWSTVDTFSDASVPASFAMGVTTDGTNVLVGGQHNESSTSSYHWVVRKSGSQATTWSTQSDVTATKFQAATLALDTDPSGNIFAAGYNYDGSGYHWQVRKRTASGTTWTLIDDQAPTSYSMYPVAIVAPATNVVYVSGYEWNTLGGAYSWIVRKTSNGGTSWTTVDNFTDNGWSCSARAMGWSSQESALYVSGRCNDGTAYHWITRRTADGGTSWTIDDDFQLTVGQASVPNGVSATNGGHVYVGGTGSDGTHNHWLVRRRACSAVAPVSPAASTSGGQLIGPPTIGGPHGKKVGQSSPAHLQQKLLP